MFKLVRIFEGRFGRLLLAEISAAEAAHSHPEPSFAVKYDGADLEYTIRGEQVRLTRDEIMFVNANEMHSNEAPAGASAMRLLALRNSGEWLRESFPAVFAAADGRPFPRMIEPITPRIRRLTDTLVVEILNDQFLSAERLEFMLQELMLSIVDTYLARRRASSPAWRGSRFADSRIRQAIDLLRTNPNKDVSIDDLAAQVGLSRSRFYDLFQLCTGLSPREYLDKLCVESAIAKLSSGHAKIADVSAELGFSAQSNFTRFFLHQVGIPPSAYRRAASRPQADAPITPPARRAPKPIP
jgi:AraC family transcriptional regulator